MVSRIVIIENQSGLHVRPAARLSKFAEACSSKIEIVYESNVINAKSVLNIVSKAIEKGTAVELRCTGPDEEADLEFMVDAIKRIE